MGANEDTDIVADTFVSTTMCPQHCVLACHHLNSVKGFHITLPAVEDSCLRGEDVLYFWDFLEHLPNNLVHF